MNFCGRHIRLCIFTFIKYIFLLLGITDIYCTRVLLKTWAILLQLALLYVTIFRLLNEKRQNRQRSVIASLITRTTHRIDSSRRKRKYYSIIRKKVLAGVRDITLCKCPRRDEGSSDKTLARGLTILTLAVALCERSDTILIKTPSNGIPIVSVHGRFRGRFK